MRPLLDMDTIQIEITNACIHECSNCTRFCGHQKPFFMTFDQFKTAVDSMVGYPKMTGIMGGEPLLHPQFEEFCNYAVSKIPRMQLGLWTCFPDKFKKYREVVVRTFGNIFLNDHSRPDIYHAPLLVAAKDVVQDEDLMWTFIDKCWIQNCWSACINPKGAFFCEIAGSMSILFNGSKGWDLTKDWWKKAPIHFHKQMIEFCPGCGGAFTLNRRISTEEIDDISESNLKRLKGNSKRIDEGKYVMSDLKIYEKPQQMAAYKDMNWRQRIAARYGIFLTVNAQGFCEPHLQSDEKPRKSVFELIKTDGL